MGKWPPDCATKHHQMPHPMKALKVDSKVGYKIHKFHTELQNPVISMMDGQLELILIQFCSYKKKTKLPTSKLVLALLAHSSSGDQPILSLQVVGWGNTSDFYIGGTMELIILYPWYCIPPIWLEFRCE